MLTIAVAVEMEVEVEVEVLAIIFFKLKKVWSISFGFRIRVLSSFPVEMRDQRVNKCNLNHKYVEVASYIKIY